MELQKSAHGCARPSFFFLSFVILAGGVSSQSQIADSLAIMPRLRARSNAFVAASKVTTHFTTQTRALYLHPHVSRLAFSTTHIARTWYWLLCKWHTYVMTGIPNQICRLWESQRSSRSGGGGQKFKGIGSLKLGMVTKQLKNARIVPGMIL